jgi:phosphopantothenoylcysteine decarboxylase/phosphopantothenate--cysteine ligase
MGYALAETFADQGAEVTLVSGPVNLEPPVNLKKVIKVRTAAEMLEHCITEFAEADVTVMAAAVADYTPDSVAGQKMKKQSAELVIRLKPTGDILKKMGEKKMENQFLVGFALETENEVEHAKQKLENKNLDLIVLNSLRDKGAGFDHTTNKIKIINKKGDVLDYPLKSKKMVAADIIDVIAENLGLSKEDQ